MPDDAVVEVHGLTYEYPTIRALDNVSFTLAKASITALVGPNGAGKTTLLRCLAGLDFPLSGKVLLNGAEVTEDPRASHRYLGYLSDSFGLYESLSVRQCLQFAAESQLLDFADFPDLIESTASKLTIEQHLDKPVCTLSRGMRQRVAIAQAIIHRPLLLLLDEPASGLDPDARHALSELFLQLRDEGMTLLVSSHILAELKEYCTAMLVLNQGQLLQHTQLQQPKLETKINMAVKLGRPKADFAGLLGQHAGVSEISGKDMVFKFRLLEGTTPKHDLLQRLLAQEVAVSEFYEVNDLQQSYLDAVKADVGDKR